MGCACLRSKAVIKTKHLPQGEKKIESVRNPREHHSNENHVDNLHLVPESNSPNRRIQRNPGSQNFDFQPYLISQHDPSFNFPEVDDEIMTGTGLKRMKGYISVISRETLEKRRRDFWATRVEGDPEIWEFLKNICTSNDIEESELRAYLSAVGISPYNDCINVTYDTKGAIYEIPNYCINDPYLYDLPELQVKNRTHDECQIKVILRKSNDEISVCISNFAKVEKLKQSVTKMKDIKGKIRLFFGGKELLDDKELWSCNISEGSIVCMMIQE